MTTTVWLIIAGVTFVLMIASFGLGLVMGCAYQRNEGIDNDEYPKCTCGDVNQCDIWCIGKENFRKHHP